MDETLIFVFFSSMSCVTSPALFENGIEDHDDEEEVEDGNNCFKFSPSEPVKTNFATMATSPNKSNRSGNLCNDDDLKSHEAAISESPAVWSMDSTDGLTLLGCSSGRVEVWGSEDGTFKVKRLKS